MVHSTGVQAALAALLGLALVSSSKPAVNVHASWGSLSGVRRVDVTFTPDSDEYVVVGHVDADGALRIAYPASPGDTGVFKGGRSYHVPPFDAGFTTEYNSKRRQPPYQFRTQDIRNDSYDGFIGYLFVIASPHQLHRDAASTDDGGWASYDLSDDDLRDPRPFIKDIAATLAGDPKDVSVTYVTRFLAHGWRSSTR